MEILYLGHAAFKIKTASAILVIDPFDPDFVSLPWKKQEADLICISHEHRDHNFLEGVSGRSGEPFVISGPGEYEVRGILVFGISAFHDKRQGLEKGPMTLFRIETEGIVVAHLGNLGHLPSEDLFGQLEGVDILLLPVDGVGSIGPKEASEVANHISPSLVVPMHYSVPGSQTENWGFASVDDFLEEMGAEKTAPVDKLKIKSRNDFEEELQVVLMKSVQ